METIEISLPKNLMAYIKSEVSSGEYKSASDVVDHALRLLKQERDREAEELRVLRKEIQIGIDAAERGEFSDRTLDEIFHDVLDQHYTEVRRVRQRG